MHIRVLGKANFCFFYEKTIFFAKKFAHVRKKQYLCTRFWQMTHFGRVGEWLKPTVC